MSSPENISSTAVEEIQNELESLASKLESGDPEMYSFVETRIITLMDSITLLGRCYLNANTTEALSKLNSSYHILQELICLNSSGYATGTLKRGDRGRPPFDINKEQILYFMDQDFNAGEIATMLGVSERTIRRRCQDFDIKFSDQFSNMTDEQLDSVIIDQIKIFPNIGHRMMRGVLQHLGFRVQRQRILDSMKRVDPIGIYIRSLAINVTPRRGYNVFSPQSLWHLDGHHKLIRWRFVTHGGIDGFSRLVVFLVCSTNNKAKTVLQYFLHATHEYGVPSRIRSDKGGENMEVARFMLEHPNRGPERGSVITGPSTHNTRIERLWRDVFSGCLHFFYSTFYYMEDIGILDPTNETHIWCLHFVFHSRINQQLDSFKHGYNKHKIRTAGNRSPEQLWTAGLLSVANSSARVSQEIFNGNDSILEENLHEYGVDYDAPIQTEPDILVEVPTTPTPLNKDDYDILCSTINVLRQSDNHGIDIYEEVLSFIQSVHLEF